MLAAPLAPQQAGAALLRHHGRRLRGHLLRRGAAARVEPREPPAAGPPPLAPCQGRAPLEELLAGEASSPKIDRRVRSGRRRHRRARDAAQLERVVRGPAGPGPRAALLPALRLARGGARLPARRRAGTRDGRADRAQPERLRHVRRPEARHRGPAAHGPRQARLGRALLAGPRGRGRDRVVRPRARADRHRAPRSCWRWWAATWWRSALARRVRRLEARGARRWPAGASSSRCRWTRATSSASSRARSTRCRSSCGRWTSPAGSSSPRRRTSCARRSSRSPGSWSCCRTRTSTSDTRREFLDTMSEQVARLQKLSVDLLDLSRLDTGSLQLEREPVDLAELARSVVGEFAPGAQPTTTPTSRSSCRTRDPRRRCDRERVAQIMRILLDNAIRHTPEGTAGDRVGRAQQRNRDAHGVRPRARALRGHPRARPSSASSRATPPAAPASGLAIARELAERMDGDLASLRHGRGRHLHARSPVGRRARA